MNWVIDEDEFDAIMLGLQMLEDSVRSGYAPEGCSLDLDQIEDLQDRIHGACDIVLHDKMFSDQ